MSQPPQDPHIPTLTHVVKSAVRPQLTESPAEPKPGLAPMDLDIDFSLEALDEPGLDAPEQERPISLDPPGFLEILQPPPPPRTAPPDPASADLHAQIEAAVDEALAAQIPELRKHLVGAVIKTLSPSGNPSDEDLPGA